ncbi:MAG: segregation and condensation protein A [Anaerolineae bacterium]
MSRQREDTITAYQVALDVFEGPLDVLLRLIEHEELDVTKVSLTLVADQFLAHIARLQEISAANLADFLLVAAKLLVIKSQSLLPRSDEEEDEEDEEDVGEQLARQLLEYKRYKEVAQKLRGIEEKGLRTFPRTAQPPQIVRRLQPGEVSLAELLKAFRQALEAHPPMPAIDTVVAPVVIHIADCIRTITNMVHRYTRIRFSTLMRRAHSRTEVIVTFMAILELIKQQQIVATQERAFGEIYIEAHEPDPEAQIAPLDLSEYGEAPETQPADDPSPDTPPPAAGYEPGLATP